MRGHVSRLLLCKGHDKYAGTTSSSNTPTPSGNSFIKGDGALRISIYHSKHGKHIKIISACSGSSVNSKSESFAQTSRSTVFLGEICSNTHWAETLYQRVHFSLSAGRAGPSGSADLAVLSSHLHRDMRTRLPRSLLWFPSAFALHGKSSSKTYELPSDLLQHMC